MKIVIGGLHGLRQLSVLPPGMEDSSSTSSIETKNGSKIISTKTGVSSCIANILAGLVSANLTVFGFMIFRNYWHSAYLFKFKGIEKIVPFSSAIGIGSGILSENKKESAENAALFGALVGSVLFLVNE